MKKFDFDIAIIGGGVIGLMTAFAIKKKGYSVVIIDRNPKLAMEASRAGGGIISPLHPWRYSQAMLDLASWSHERFSAISHELSYLSGIDVPVRKTGMLVPNIDEADSALKCSFLKAKILNSDQVFTVEPGISKPTESVFVEDVHNIRNPALCRAMPIAAKRMGIEIKTDFHIQLAQKQQEMFSLESGNETLRAEKVVISSGAWSSQVMKLFAGAIPKNVPEIFPVKGQMLAYKAVPGVLRTVILEHNRYLIPRHDGVIVVGSTVENADFDKQATSEAYQELLAFAEDMLPALKQYPVISHWAGLRPGSQRDKPIICASKDMKGLYLNVGHFRNGLLSAPASAQVLMDVMFNQASDFDLNSYSI